MRRPRSCTAWSIALPARSVRPLLRCRSDRAAYWKHLFVHLASHPPAWAYWLSLAVEDNTVFLRQSRSGQQPGKLHEDRRVVKLDGVRNMRDLWGVDESGGRGWLGDNGGCCWVCMDSERGDGMVGLSSPSVHQSGLTATEGWTHWLLGHDRRDDLHFNMPPRS